MIQILRPLGVFALAGGLMLSGCSNPADNTPAAVVSEPVEVAAAASAPTSAPASAPTAVPASAPTSAPAQYPPESQPIAPKLYVTTPESRVGFVGSKITGSHTGGFNAMSGEIAVVDGNPEQSSIHVTIDTTSIWTDTEKLTNHLKSPDFFDVAQHPTARFVATRVVPADAGYEITGNLTLHGVTKSVTFPAMIDVTDDRITAQAKFHIKRFDFDIAYPGKADDLIRDEVVITLDIVATPAPRAT